MDEKKVDKAKASVSPSFSEWVRSRTADKGNASRGTSAETERLGREQQRRATAYARARGRL